MREKQMSKTNVAPFRPTDTKNRELSWFAQMVERGKKEPFSEIVTITPAIAERLLELNENNRLINEDQISAIAKDISSGFWQLNGETIIVSKDGLLNDGQNRLHAVVRAGEPIRTAIMFGVSRESRMSVDMGRQRRASDFLRMDGVSNSFRAAALVAIFELYKRGVYSNNVGRNGIKITKQELLAAYYARQKQYDHALQICDGHKIARSMGGTPICAGYMICKEVNATEAEVFFARLIDGTSLQRGSVILAVRNRLMDSSNRLHSHEKLELILRAWNMWRAGKNTGKSPLLCGAYPKVSR